MGLAEKRAVKRYESEKFPALKKELDKVCGFDVPLEVRWDTIADTTDTNPDLFEESLTKVYFKPLIEAFRDICKDDLGRKSLKAKLKKITVSYLGGTSEISFKGGELTFVYHPTTNIDYWGERKEEIQKVIEQAL